MKKLAEKFGVKDERVYVDPWEELRKAFTISFKNGTFQDLVNGDTLVLRYKPLKKYQTPSGKIEFYSSIALPENNPLPVQIPLSDNSDEFVLLNSSLPKWTHTQFRDVYGLIPSVAWINPSDANRLDIKTGEEVTLYNDLAELKITSVVTSKIRKGVLWTPRELKDSFNNIQNSLTPGIPQKLGGGPIFNSVRVRIKKE
jgi:anaerobic selenocysteine-containing dehydrogenase